MTSEIVYTFILFFLVQYLVTCYNEAGIRMRENA